MRKLTNHCKKKKKTNRKEPAETADLVTFTKEILNGKLHFLCSETDLHVFDITVTTGLNPFMHNVEKWPNILKNNSV